MEPILLNLPQTLQTERLLLRLPRPGDGALLATSVRASLPELKPWMPWATDEYGEADAELWARRVHGEFHLRVQLQYLMLHRESGEHVGTLGAFKFHWKFGQCEVGYWTRTDHVGRGLMVEAVGALTGMLVDVAKMRRIEIRCDERNLRSARVAERCGYQHEGTLRCNSVDGEGIARSTRIYARIRSSPGTPSPDELIQSAG